MGGTHGGGEVPNHGGELWSSSKLNLKVMGDDLFLRSYPGVDEKKEKQLLFKSKSLGDDSDRALLKPDGEQTYFMSDIIYHQNKINRKFDTLINIWGVDHSGYVKRLKNAIKELKSEIKLYRKNLDDTEEVASNYAKNIVKIARRIEFASIYPPNALNEMQEAILEFDDLQNKEQGGLRLIDILLFL